MLILGVFQGIAEFLPISSSGHLAIAQKLLQVQANGVAVEVALHVGTLVSILVFYRKRIVKLATDLAVPASEGRSYALAVIIGSIPAFTLGFIFRHQVEAVSDNVIAVSGLLVANGFMLGSLALTRGARTGFKLLDALLIGLAQAVAILPGISRSGATITSARHLGIEPAKAAEFSLLLSIPAVSAAALYKLVSAHAGDLGGIPLLHLALGAIAAAVVGYFAIGILVRTLSTRYFWLFGVYCIIAGLAGVFLFR